MIEIVVIGGGAAGMMAAITAARQGGQVTLLEPNERLGKKLNITGKGRCNVTNDCDQETLMANIPGNGRFLYSALTRFTPQDAMAFFEGLGVPLKVERGRQIQEGALNPHDVLRIRGASAVRRSCHQGRQPQDRRGGGAQVFRRRALRRAGL